MPGFKSDNGLADGPGVGKSEAGDNSECSEPESRPDVLFELGANGLVGSCDRVRSSTPNVAVGETITDDEFNSAVGLFADTLRVMLTIQRNPRQTRNAMPQAEEMPHKATRYTINMNTTAFVVGSPVTN